MATFGTLLTWAFFGLVVDAIARLLYPGRQPIGFVATMVLGVVGSLLGGFISYLFGYDPADGPLQGSGWIMSIVGALIVTWAALYAGGSRRIGA